MGTKKQELLNKISNAKGSEFYFIEYGQEIDALYTAVEAKEIIESLEEVDLQNVYVREY